MDSTTTPTAPDDPFNGAGAGPDAAAGGPDAAPLTTPPAKLKGFADPARRQAALDARLAKRGAKPRKDKPAKAAPSPSSDDLDGISKLDAVQGALVLTAQMTGDGRWMVVGQQHGPAIADALDKLAKAFKWDIKVDPRLTAAGAAAIVSMQCWQTFAALPPMPIKPATTPAPVPLRPVPDASEAHG